MPWSRLGGGAPGPRWTDGPTVSPPPFSAPAWGPGQGRPVPLQRSGVPRVPVRGAEGGRRPGNTNYRYTTDEFVYLWDNADTEAIIFDASFVDRVEAVRGRLPGVRLWLQVGTDAVAEWAVPYEQAAAAPPPGPVRGPWGR